MLTKLVRSCLVLIVFGACAIVQADDRQQIEASLNAAYKGKVLTLRNFYSGTNLQYNGDGDLVKGGPAGPWTADGSIEVKEIRFEGDKLEIEGNRLVLAYHDATKRFLGMPAEKIRMEMQVRPDTASLSTVQMLIGKVFLGPDEKLADLVPADWRPFLSGEQESTKQPQSNGVQTVKELQKQIGKTGGDVSYPVPIHKPEPPYTSGAREAKLQGTIVFWLVVDADGKVKDVSLVKPLGGGLDENAMRTVSTWKFKPAMRNGLPAAVSILVEISFRLFRKPSEGHKTPVHPLQPVVYSREES